MYGVVAIFTFLAVAWGDTPSDPSRVYCGFTPDSIYACLHNPKVIKQDVSVKCDKSTSECDRMNCIFRESGWLDGSNVDKQKVSAYFDQFAKDQPEWSTAVQHLKTDCLNKDLPAQGVILNCPAYDIVHCALTAFIKNASPSQWSTAEQCAYSRSYASACPVCPSSCFAPQVPIGSCNACYLPPRTPQS
uniref:Odorant binding protein n=1 Tax=Dendrolimus kikuchii TaxID=765133 RepID=A0A076E950_9NEOP|nr:odorant binding protein [Dendrolimus kikuchii]